MVRERAWPRVTSALFAHDAALDEHHDQPAFIFAVAQAISSGRRKSLTLLEGLPVSHLHVVHHVAHASLLLCESGGGCAERGEGRNDDNQSTHEVSPLHGTRRFPERVHHVSTLAP